MCFKVILNIYFWHSGGVLGPVSCICYSLWRRTVYIACSPQIFHQQIDEWPRPCNVLFCRQSSCPFLPPFSLLSLSFRRGSSEDALLHNMEDARLILLVKYRQLIYVLEIISPNLKTVMSEKRREHLFCKTINQKLKNSVFYILFFTFRSRIPKQLFTFLSLQKCLSLL